MFGTGTKLMARINAPTSKADRIPPRLSTASVVSFTWAGTSRHAMKKATAASGSVTTKTDPHANCSRSRPAINGPSEAIAPPSGGPERDGVRSRRAGPEGRDHRERGGVRHARGEASEEPRSDQDLDARGERGEQAGRDRQCDAREEHQLSAVAVAKRAEPQHRRRETERVADGHEVELDLGGVERLADRGQCHIRDRQVQVGDCRNENQRNKDELCTRRAGPFHLLVGSRCRNCRGACQRAPSAVRSTPATAGSVATGERRPVPLSAPETFNPRRPGRRHSDRVTARYADRQSPALARSRPTGRTASCGGQIPSAHDRTRWARSRATAADSCRTRHRRTAR